MNTEDDAAVLIAENLRRLRESRGLKQEEVATLMNARLGIRDGDEDDKKRKKGWYQSTLYKIENVPPQRKISFREGVLLADIYGVPADALLRPNGSEDEQWAAISEAAAEVDRGIYSLDGLLSWAIQRSRALERVLKTVPRDSMPLDSERVLANSAPELLEAMKVLQRAIQKHGEVRQPVKTVGGVSYTTEDGITGVIGNDGMTLEYDTDEWNAWENGELDEKPTPTHSYKSR